MKFLPLYTKIKGELYRGIVLRRNTVISTLLLSLLGLLFIFQNCGRPHMPARTDNNKSEIPPYNPDLEPDLDREGDGDPVELGDGKVLYSSVRRAGTAQHDSNWSLSNTSDGGYITAGVRAAEIGQSNSYNILFQKFNDKGDLVYAVEIAEDFQDQGYRAIELPNSYLVVGKTLTLLEGEPDSRKGDSVFVYLNKADGKIIEAKRIGNNHFQQINDVIYVNDVNPYLIAVGRFYQNANEQSGLIMKLDLGTNIIWEKKYTLDNSIIEFRSVTHAPGKGFYVVGSRKPSNANHGDSMITRFNEGGFLLDSQVTTSQPNHDDFFSDVIHARGRIIVFGRMAGNGYNTDGSLIIFDYNLGFKNAFMVGENSSPSYFTGGRATHDGGFIMAGKYRPPGDSQWYNWLVKLNQYYKVEFSKGYGINHNSYGYYSHPVTIRKDFGYALIANVKHEPNGAAMDPYLLLINQYGEIPSGCGLNARNLNATVKDKSGELVNNELQGAIEFRGITPSEQNLSLDIDDILGDEVNFNELDPGRNNYCVEEAYILYPENQ